MDDQLPYTIESIASKSVTLTADPTIIWSLHSDNTNTPYVTPVGYSVVGSPFTVDTIAHHNNGKDYYLIPSGSQGYCVDDCKDTVETPVIEPEIVPEKPSGIPGGLNVPRAVQQKILIKVDLPTYPTPGLAQKMEKPSKHIVRRGMHEFDELKYGMLRLKDTNYWINPADNVLPPVVVVQQQPAYLPDTRHDYSWNVSPILYKASSDHMKQLKKGEVFSFKRDKNNIPIQYNQPVWIAGTFISGDQLYGVPAAERENDTFYIAKDYGVLMSYLKLQQMDYAPEDTIQDVQPAEAAAMVPQRDLSLKDHKMVLKGRTQRVMDDIFKRRRI